ncbi:hypothetical protein TVAG_159450 [Trichomonas vaginalis G3]|uniref:Uncharacterized protein n=1 Tax=Trichomonas vaginalis (strain ATCC PRA-98 / G3) TaxID=412133 RepID=A2F5A0_TRIV3|nr:hypothetical protein TVAGG3_0160000 [Trichomonas vaginalis G3]EAX99925.1 hypothetical protein TVAG_159450 [Trichomonas vaginalis G3]KAI5547794.1 hypothetical protein TVAGG3_0160000 [Trichomonas vaginalis G3]|eukprot:XP_001312855.1 hypothetical protein [Trichomonas vaginalis G3]
MSLSYSATCRVKIHQVGSTVNKSIIKFRCDQCNKSVDGFPEYFAECAQINVDEFYESFGFCPKCHTPWDQLRPIYEAYFAVEQLDAGNTPGINGFSSMTCFGDGMNEIMGFTVDEFIELGNQIGFNLLFHLAAKFLEGSEFIIRFQNNVFQTISLPLGNQINFKRFLDFSPLVDSKCISMASANAFEHLEDDYLQYAPNVKFDFD